MNEYSRRSSTYYFGSKSDNLGYMGHVAQIQRHGGLLETRREDMLGDCPIVAGEFVQATKDLQFHI